MGKKARPEDKINNLDDSDTDTLIDDIEKSIEVQDTKESLRSRTIAAVDYTTLILIYWWMPRTKRLCWSYFPAVKAVIALKSYSYL
jgi:hypothetical protein